MRTTRAFTNKTANRHPVRNKPNKQQTHQGRGKRQDQNTTKQKGVGLSARQEVWLSFPFHYLLNNVASATVAKRWYTNGLYDVDPVLGSTVIPYFQEWASLYAYNRVTEYKVSISCSNLEAFPVTVYFVHTNTDPGTSGTTYEAIANGPRGRVIQLASANAQTSGICRMEHTIRSVVGDQITKTDQNFVGISAANPSDLTYFGIGLQGAGANLTNGVWISGSIMFYCQFFDQLRVTTFFRQQPSSIGQVMQAYRRIIDSDTKGAKRDPADEAILKAMVLWKKEWALACGDALSSPDFRSSPAFGDTSPDRVDPVIKDRLEFGYEAPMKKEK